MGGGINDMLSPPCQNMGGIHHPHPPQDLRPCWLVPCYSDLSCIIHVSSQFYMLLVGHSTYSLCYALPYQDQANIVSYVTMCFSDVWILTSSARIRPVRIAVCDAFLPSCESIFKMVRSMRIIL